MSEKKIIVTRRWPKAVEKELQSKYSNVQLNQDDRPMSKEELQDALCTADCVLPTVTDPLNAEVLGISDIRCRFLGNFGVGFNHIDLDAAKAAGITVSNTPEVLTDCTADIAMTLMLMSARRTGEGERHVRANAWTGWRPTHMMGTKVTGKTIGLVGFGRIARAMAHKAHYGFGMNIIYYDPSARESDEQADAMNATLCASVEDLLQRADFVSLHCPGGEQTYHLINEEKLALMKPTAYLINSARGDVIDNQALIKALKNKQIAGAGLDVFEGEPNLDPGFLDLENIVLLPHLGSASLETRIMMGQRVLENLDAFLNHTPMKDKLV